METTLAAVACALVLLAAFEFASRVRLKEAMARLLEDLRLSLLWVGHGAAFLIAPLFGYRPMWRICAWCKVTMGFKLTRKGGITSSICKRCFVMALCETAKMHKHWREEQDSEQAETPLNSCPSKVLTIYSDTLKGDLLLETVARLRRLFPEARFRGHEDPEGKLLWMFLPAGTDSRAALADVLELLRTVPVPRDTFVSDDAAEDHDVYEERKPRA